MKERKSGTNDHPAPPRGGHKSSAEIPDAAPSEKEGTEREAGPDEPSDKDVPETRMRQKDRVLAELVAGEAPLTQKELSDRTKIRNLTHPLNQLLEEGKILIAQSQGARQYQARPSRTRKFAQRSELNAHLKRQIGMAAVELVYGGVASSEVPLVTQREKLLSRFKGSCRSNLEAIYSRRERSLYLDGGTSTQAVARQLVPTPLPSLKLHVWNVEVVTNNPAVASVLVDYDDSPEVILIGGRLQRENLAIAGYLSDQFIRRMDYLADFCVLGCAAMDLQRGFGAATEDEAYFKSLMLQRAAVSCVVMDSTKNAPASQPAWPFAPVSGDAVHILITDDGILTHSSFMAELVERGIQVFCPSFGVNQAQRA